MTPAQRALILSALGLTPRNGRMPRWSRKNDGYIQIDHPEACDMVEGGLIYPHTLNGRGMTFRVTRFGTEAAGVLGRCRREDLGDEIHEIVGSIRGRRGIG